jgi:hypothetical protein
MIRDSRQQISKKKASDVGNSNFRFRIKKEYS